LFTYVLLRNTHNSQVDNKLHSFDMSRLMSLHECLTEAV